MISCRAYAKVNLALAVLGKRDDGYHELCSIMQTVDLYDEIQAQAGNRITLQCSIRSLAGSDNLAYRAACLLAESQRVSRGARLYLRKNIPIAAGLGGGSADAAATLVALRMLWQLKIDDSELRLLAAELGSDVPFFIGGGTALVSGRGEQVTPLPAAPMRWLVLVKPKLRLANKTATMYGLLSPRHFETGEGVARAMEQIRGGEFPADEHLSNTFMQVAPHVFPNWAKIRRLLSDLAGRPALLSGAGPTLFFVFDSPQLARSAYEALNIVADWEVWLVRSGNWRPLAVLTDPHSHL